MRLIDADEFINELSQLYAYAGWDKRDIHFSLSDVACNLEMMPVFNVVLDFQAETPKHGHWDCNGFEPVRCSVCGITVDAINGIPWAIKSFNYCPHCGAKMDENEWEEPEINPCRGCVDYDGQGGCKSNGGCGAEMDEVEDGV